MIIAPKSEIVMLHVPLEIDNKNQLTFEDSNKQFEYFRFLDEQKVYDNCTYVRKDNYVVVNDYFDNLTKYNYIMYQNESYSTKWYYAFITKMEYLSNNSTKVYIETDSWQTYQFDIEFKKSFIEREHVLLSEDTPRKKLNF